MKTVAVVGTQWGDEGKGKIVDMLAADADVVVRFQAETMQHTRWWSVERNLFCDSCRPARSIPARLA